MFVRVAHGFQRRGNKVKIRNGCIVALRRERVNGIDFKLAETKESPGIRDSSCVILGSEEINGFLK